MKFPAIWALSFALAIPIGGLWMLAHSAHHAAPSPAVAGLVTFPLSSYSSYGAPTFSGYGPPSFTVDVANGNASPVTVHTLTVRFIDYRAARVIADVTERPDAAVPAGQSAALTFSAPEAVVNAPVTDEDITVTIAGWT